MNRRKFMLGSLLAILFLPLRSFNRTNQETWDLSCLENLTPGQVIDLNCTLPDNVKKGGRFYLDARSAPLPQNLELSLDGKLTVGNSHSFEAKNLVFIYDETPEART